MSVFLGIDVGTSGTKTLAMREDGRILSSTTVDYPLSSPKPGWSEQNPADWWQATLRSVRRVLKDGKIKPAAVAGIGLSGQMHGSVFLDKYDQVSLGASLPKTRGFSSNPGHPEGKIPANHSIGAIRKD